MRISLVVAAAENGVIGKDNALLWRLPDDLKFFKAITMGKPVIMGRKTFDAIGRPLPGRRNVVVTRQADLTIPGCELASSLDAALAMVAEVPEAAVIGGADIYRQVLPRVDIIYLTRVHATLDGDVFFHVPEGQWRETHREWHAADERHAHSFSFITLERNGKSGKGGS